jgi:uncharacterized YccA/Bax inhibitor family protein
VRSSNPVLTRLGEASRRERAAVSPDYDLGGYQVQQPTYQPQALHDAMTVDDVVVRTVSLLLVTGITGALSWLFIPDGPMVAVSMIGSSLAALVLGLVISFARITNPVPIVAYAVLEGAMLGVVSRWFESAYNGIVIQAVVGTLGVFIAMAVLYKKRVLRATPKFTRFVLGALIGIVVLSLVNFGAAAFGHNLHLIEYGVTGKVGMMPIIFSLAAIAIGALTFILDFDMVEQGARAGLPQKYSWYCAFGLLVGLIFLYWQILRLLGYARR